MRILTGSVRPVPLPGAPPPEPPPCRAAPGRVSPPAPRDRRPRPPSPTLGFAQAGGPHRPAARLPAGYGTPGPARHAAAQPRPGHEYEPPAPGPRVGTRPYPPRRAAAPRSRTPAARPRATRPAGTRARPAAQPPAGREHGSPARESGGTNDPGADRGRPGRTAKARAPSSGCTGPALCHVESVGALLCCCQPATRTMSAWGPFWPCEISNSTRWPSSRVR